MRNTLTIVESKGKHFARTVDAFAHWESVLSDGLTEVSADGVEPDDGYSER
jgi:hypothetical protein